jgi:alkylation response protein AidB-like acyl-CoA dehydrogenase
MRSLELAREVCDRYHPGLCKSLADLPLAQRETPDGGVVDLFRTRGGPALIVPTAFGGLGAPSLDAIRVQRAVSSYSPSLGAAATMHHFTVAMLFALAQTASRLTTAQLELLSRVAPENLLLASGWAEGKPDQNILVPTVTARRARGGYRVNGSKKPCSLSRSMDVLTASVMLPERGGSGLALLLIPASSKGISRHPFWSTPVLAGAESDEVRLTDVFVPDELVVRTVPEDPHRLDDLQTAGFVWFELLISSAYAGAASALVELALEKGRGSVTDRLAAAVHLESAISLLDGVARAVEDGVDGDEAVASVLVARYGAQEALRSAVDLAVEVLGGMAFVQAPDVAYLASATRPLAFHPPSRTSAAQALVDYFAGGPLILS